MGQAISDRCSQRSDQRLTRVAHGVRTVAPVCSSSSGGSSSFETPTAARCLAGVLRGWRGRKKKKKGRERPLMSLSVLVSDVIIDKGVGARASDCIVPLITLPD